MSTRETFFLYNGSDLSGIFQPLSFGSSSSIVTGCISQGEDLNQLFAQLSSGSSLGYNVGYTAPNGQDLSAIFAKYNPLTPFTSTSGILTTTNYNEETWISNFSMPSGYTNFNFYIFGGGGNGYQNEGNAGGGGSGAFIQATSVPYNNSEVIISSISYIVGSGGQDRDYSAINIYYSNSTFINITATSGINNTGGDSGEAGGSSSSSNNTSFYSNSNITKANGASGGNGSGSPTSGSSSGYTCSGSGGNSSGPYTNNSSATFTITGTDGVTFTNISVGGGSNQVVSGYGSGGASTIANYVSNAPAYRDGKQGCIIYYLS